MHQTTIFSKPTVKSIFSSIFSPFFLVVVVSVALILYVGNFVARYAVNMLYWDQWDYLRPLFNTTDPWQALYHLFIFQHGPHRLGLGAVVMMALAKITGWNTRADAFAVFAFIVAAMLSALALKKALFRKWSWSDFVVPLIFLTLQQQEIFLAVPNESLVSLPVCLVMLLCLSWLIPNRPVSRALILVIYFFLTFTGFGLLITPIIIFLLAWDVYQDFRNQRKTWAGSVISLGIAFIIILLFLINYHFDPAVSCFSLSIRNMLIAPVFMGLLYLKFLGIDYLGLTVETTLVASLLLLLIIVSIFLYHLIQLLKNDQASHGIDRAIVILIGYSLIFGMSSAIGRVCLGLEASQASRYIPFTFPAFLGLYFHILALPKTKYNALILIVFVFLQFYTLHPVSYYSYEIHQYSEQKQAWKSCYLKHENIKMCNDSTGFQIYPSVDGRLKGELDYLKTHQVNLYLAP